MEDMNKRDTSQIDASEAPEALPQSRTEVLDAQVDEAQVNELLDKYDSESRMVENKGFTARALTVITVVMTLYQLYLAGFNFLNVNRARALHLAFILVIVFLSYPTIKTKRGKKKIAWLDWIIACVTASGSVYVFLEYTNIVLRNGRVTMSDYIFGIITVFGVLYAAYRVQGLILPLLCGLMVVYAFVGPYMPGILMHRGFTVRRLVSQLFMGNEGIFGTPLGVSCTYIFLFVFFGVLLGETGLSKYMTDLALTICGDRPGGPAKMAVVSSALMGMISGNAVANVVTTGAFSIPLMKKTGYKSHFAGAVEAVASTGGQIMPPIMGAAAFIMAEMLSVSYRTIILAAIVPAVLYYVSLLLAVDFEAKKNGLQGISKENLPSAWELTRQYWHLLVPVVMLVWMIIAGRATYFAAFWSIIALLIISSLRKNTRLSVKGLIAVCEKAAKQAVAAGIATAVVGILIGVVNLTGLGLSLASIILKLSHNMLLPTLLLTMLACIVLGMGLPTSAAYIVAGTVAPIAMQRLGVEALTSHMFVFYFACLSAITPPVALAAFAAAGIADTSPHKVGWTAVRIGIVGFVIPFMFVYAPGLLMQGDPLMIIWNCITAVVGVYLMAAGMVGFLRVPANMLERIILVVAALSLISGDLITDGIGILIGAVMMLVHLGKEKRLKAAAEKGGI